MHRSSVNVPLTESEARALLEMANVECRHPREQMRWLLVQEAERRGLLLTTTDEPATKYKEEMGARNG